MHTLIQDLAENPAGYDFFLAVRILQAASAGPRVGCANTPADETVYFLQRPGAMFVGSSIEGIRWEPKPTLLIRGFGLLGPKGCLPIWVNDFALRQQALRNPETPDRAMVQRHPGMESHPFWTESAFVAFCHLLEQRFASFFYRAWELHQLPPALDRNSSDPESNDSGVSLILRQPVLRSLMALAGFLAVEAVNRPVPVDRSGSAGASPKLPLSTEEWLARYQRLWKLVAFHSGRLSSAIRNPEGLQAILQDEFRVPFSIVEFLQSWVTCPVEARCQLSSSGQISNSRLSVLGSRCRDAQTKFRVRVGPMSLDDYHRFLPGRPDHERLKDLVTLYCGDELGWDLQLVLNRHEVPPTILGSDNKKQRPSLLAWTTWLAAKGAVHPEDADEHILQIQPELN